MAISVLLKHSSFLSLHHFSNLRSNSTNRYNRLLNTMKLTDFPNEILHSIVSKVTLYGDLASLMLVSHEFKILAEFYLYRIVHLDAEPLEECRLGFLPTLKRTDQLIANLKARPQLGRHTIAFSLRVSHPLWYQSYPQLSIISRMPRLRQLSYDPPAVHGGVLSDECKNLTALRLDFSHITNDYDDYGGLLWLQWGIPLEIIAKNMWHPSLRKLQAERLFFADGFEHDHFLGKRQRRIGGSPVEDLRFLHCSPQIDGNVLAAFINSIRRLKCFVLEIQSPLKAVDMRSDQAPKVDLRPALLAHQATIEELAISLNDPVNDWVDFVQSPGPFVQWAALKRLAVPSFMLSRNLAHRGTLHEALPPQLQELQLTNRFATSPTQVLGSSEHAQASLETDLSLMKELAMNKAQSVPGLKRLIWWLQYPSPRVYGKGRYWLDAPVDEMDALESIFHNVGVKFECVSPTFFRETPVGQRLYEW